VACHTAYSGLLLALNGLFQHKGIEIPKNRQKSRYAISVEFYRDKLGKLNKSILRDFNDYAYPYLHEYGGYDGNLSVVISQEGIKKATEIIDWVGQQIGNNSN